MAEKLEILRLPPEVSEDAKTVLSQLTTLFNHRWNTSQASREVLRDFIERQPEDIESARAQAPLVTAVSSAAGECAGRLDEVRLLGGVIKMAVQALGGEVSGVVLPDGPTTESS